MAWRWCRAHPHGSPRPVHVSSIRRRGPRRRAKSEDGSEKKKKKKKKKRASAADPDADTQL